MYHNLMMENQSIFTKLVFEELSGKNLSIGQPKILEYLFTHDGAIQKEIAEACQIEPATLTSLIARMEKNGLVRRENKSGDKRYICVYLTDLGKTASNYVINAFKTIEDIALNGFSNEEQEKFIFFLKKANKNLIKRKYEDKNEKNGNS